VEEWWEQRELTMRLQMLLDEIIQGLFLFDEFVNHHHRRPRSKKSFNNNNKKTHKTRRSVSLQMRRAVQVSCFETLLCNFSLEKRKVIKCFHISIAANEKTHHKHILGQIIVKKCPILGLCFLHNIEQSLAEASELVGDG
jgi:hypothetical protein